MSIAVNTAGHSRTQEKKVANWLYLSIIAFVIFFGALFLILGQRDTLNPNHLDQKGETQRNQSIPGTTQQ